MSLEHWSKIISERLVAMIVQPPPRRRVQIWGTVALLALAVCDYYTGLAISLSILYLVPICLGTAWFGWRGGAQLAALSTVLRVVSDSGSIYPEFLPASSSWNFLAAFVIFLFVVWLLDSLITLHRNLEVKVAERTLELRQSLDDLNRLELELIQVSTRERSAFGRELHDELGQHFVATALAAQVLAQKLDDPGASEARAIVRWIEEGIAKTRKLARGLLLDRIEPERLSQELEELAVSASQAGVHCKWVHKAPRIAADAGQCAQLFRIAQEAVTNSLRHAEPRSIQITLASGDDALALTVEDEGCGMRPDGAGNSGMGLQIMGHRAKLIGASLDIQTAPGAGTRITCVLPQTQPARA